MRHYERMTFAMAFLDTLHHTILLNYPTLFRYYTTIAPLLIGRADRPNDLLDHSFGCSTFCGVVTTRVEVCISHYHFLVHRF